ncbi:MAG: ArnT family glycosyltransferase, partial [Planctomycetota bacterium]
MTGQQVISKQEGSKDRNVLAWWLLAGILLVGLILRILYLQEVVDYPDFALPQLDAGYHDYWARSLTTGDWTFPEHLSDPQIRTTPYFRPPGYPLFLSVIYYLFGYSYLAPRIIQMLLGLGNCILAYFLGKALFNRIIGLLFAAFMSVYWVFIFFEGELLAPVLLVTLSLLLMLILRLWCDGFTFWRSFRTGILLGLFAVVRPNILFFGPAILGWSCWVSHRRKDGRSIGTAMSGFLLGSIIVIAPVTIRNYIVACDFVPITSNLGLNLYIGNNERAGGVILSDIAGVEGWNSADYPSIVRYCEALQGRKMKHSEVSAYFAKKAFNYIRANPARTLKLLAIKTVLFWGPEIVANNKEIHFFKQHSQILCHIPGFAMVLSLAMVGVIHLFLIYKRRGEQSDKSPQVTQEQFEMAIIMLLFVFSYFISLLPFFVAERFRVPVIPFLLLFGAYGLYRMGILIASHDLKRVIFWAIVYLVLYIETAQPRTSYTPNPIRWRYTRGNVYLLAKKSDFAIREYREAIRLGLDLPEVGASNKEFIYN